MEFSVAAPEKELLSFHFHRPEKEVLMMRKDHIILVVIISILAFLISAASQEARSAEKSATAAASTKIQIAFPSPTVSTLPIRMALKKGSYAWEGLDVELVQVNPNVSIAGLASGKLDYVTPLLTAIKAAIQGMPVRVVSIILSRSMHYLVAKPEIKKIPQLKGGSIRVNAIGDLTHDELKAALAKFGIKETEVQIIGIAGEENGIVALETGRIDAAVQGLPSNLILEAKGYNRLLDLYEVLPVGTSVLAASTEKISKNPEEVKKVIRATLEGLSYMRQNKKETVDLLIEWMKMDPNLAEKTYDEVMPAYAFDGIGPREGLEISIENARQQLKLNKPVPVSGVFNLRFAEQLSVGVSK